VTFTENEANLKIQSWFGSSGGGLPRRPGLKVEGAFSFVLIVLATARNGAAWRIKNEECYCEQLDSIMAPPP